MSLPLPLSLSLSHPPIGYIYNSLKSQHKNELCIHTLIRSYTMVYSTFINLIPIALLLCSSLPNAATARTPGPEWSLPGRLKLEEVEGSNCWESLTQLQSCTAEVVLFFLNGETYLGPGCCDAIRTIQHDCWPQMLGALGYTTEEGDVLQGYCDATSAAPPPPSAPWTHRPFFTNKKAYVAYFAFSFFNFIRKSINCATIKFNGSYMLHMSNSCLFNFENIFQMFNRTY